jgi:hypothetical protein
MLGVLFSLTTELLLLSAVLPCVQSNQSLFAAAMGLCQQVAQRISRSDSGVQPAVSSSSSSSSHAHTCNSCQEIIDIMEQEAIAQ